MPLEITTEQYNGNISLRANAMDWVDGECNFSTRFQVSSGQTNTITYNASGSIYKLTIQTGDFGADFGFLVGDVVQMSYYNYGISAGTTGTTLTEVRTVTYISGNVMYLNGAFTIGTTTHANGRVFPTDGIVGGLTLTVDKMPNAIEYEFNLTQNGVTSLGSVIDAELNRFELQDVNLLSTGVPTLMTQLGNKSGGYITDVYLTYNGAPGGGNRDFTISYKFIQWGIIKSGFAEPNYYETSDHLAPISRVRAYPQYGNPNGVMVDTTENIEANTGGYNENYNGGVNNYSVQSIDWLDILGTPIDALDYSNPCTFTAVLTAPNQANPQSTYRLALAWRPIDELVYQNKLTSIANNLLFLAPEVDFIADGVVDATVYQGFADDSGARWDIADVKFEITATNELTITGRIIPNALAKTLFDNYGDGERRSTLSVSIANHTLSAINSDRVSLTLFDEDNIDAPTIGVQIPNVVSESLTDHGGVDILTPVPQITTEDDVLYTSEFLLIDNVEYEGIRYRIEAYNSATEESFKLREGFFDFTSVVNIAGQFQPNFTINQGFNLPPTTDRNHISLKRKPSLDTAGFYGIELQYGFLSDWRYWVENDAVDNDFFDITEIYFNGKNENWQRFYLPPDWSIRIAYFTRVDGVDDFNYFTTGIRTYEDDPNISTVRTFTVLSTGATPSALVANELIEIEVVFTWAIANFLNPWVEFTYEDFEAGNRWVISSVLAQGGIAANPLKPISGATTIDVTGTGTNTLTCKALIDTNLLTATSGSLSYRVYSEEEQYLVNDELQSPEYLFSLRKLSSPTFYTGNCLRVRRSSDNAEQDIGFVDDVIDTVSMEAFCGNGDGFVVTWYDQSGNTRDANQVTASRQPKIVDTGVTIVDPNNGKPAMELTSALQSHFVLSVAVNTVQVFSHYIVFNRPVASTYFYASLGQAGLSPQFMYWNTADNLATRLSGSTTLFTADTEVGDILFSSHRDNVDSIFGWKNNVAGTSGTMGTIGQPINRLFTSGSYWTGHAQEVMLFHADLLADRALYNANINGYYGIY